MSRTRTPIALSILGLAAASLTSAGCYERVVSAQGFGADRVHIRDADSPGPVRSTKVRQETTHKQLPAQRLRTQER